MCGIAGFVDLEGRFSQERLIAIANAMNNQIVHRGPDDHGVWIDPTGRCVLAQRRLSIVDLSPAGHQPMINKSGDVGLTFNGEIYNFKELRRQLISQGHSFMSECDTEVLLKLLADQLPDRLLALRGMFALAVWDSANGRLMLARDPFGKKPLYIAQGPGWFAFASELRALEVLEEFDRRISREGLAQYLWLQYVHTPDTIYEGVRKLPPGHYMFVDRSGRESQGRFFSFEAGSGTPEMPLAPTYEERLEQLESLLEQSVRRRLMSDVPLGAFLSGGVDSALVVALMRRLHVHTKTYSVGFEDSPDTEHVYAREIAERLGCEHHEIVLHPDAIELAPMVADALDEPNGDSSCLPTNLLCEFTRRHVTVALSGDGGDEMFAGYGRYFDTLTECNDPDRPLSWAAGNAYLGPRLSIFQAEDIRRFLGEIPERTAATMNRLTARLDRMGRPLLHRMRNNDVETYLPGAVLAKVDRMSMQHSLEVRCPLLDIDVARFAEAISAEDCVLEQLDAEGRIRMTGKRMLKDLLLRDLPEEWVNRRKKGFGLPAGFWDGPALREFAHDVLASSDTRLNKHLDQKQLRGWLQEQENPQCFSIYRLWPMLVLELWLAKARPPTVRMREETPTVAVRGMEESSPAVVSSPSEPT